MSGYLRILLRFSRNGKLILGYTLIKGLTLSLQGLIYNLFLLSLHYSSTMIGVLDAMAPVTVLVVSVPLGMLADRFGRKTLLIVCAMVNPCSILGLAVMTEPGWQIVFGLANGVLSSFYWIAYPAIIVESSTEADRRHLFSVNSMLMLGMGSLGYLLGGGVTVLAGALMHESPDATGPLRWGMILIFCLSEVGAIPLLWMREPSRQRRGERDRYTHDIGLYVRLLAPDALLSFGAGALLAFNQLYFAISFRLSVGGVGLFLAIAGVAGSLGALVSPLLVARLGNARAAIALQAASVPLIAALALAPALAAAMAAYTVWGFVRSAIDPTYTAFAMEQVPDSQRSTLSGFYAVTWAVGFGCGPIATGWLRGATGGFKAPFLLAAAAYAVACASLFVSFGRGRAADKLVDTSRPKPAAR